MIRTLIGGIIGWLISYYFNSEGNKKLEGEIKNLKQDQYKLNKYLSKETQRVIMNSKKENMTVKELNELIKDKTFDEGSPEPLPYKRCPKCGNEDLYKSGNLYKGEQYYFVECKECNWNEWCQ